MCSAIARSGDKGDTCNIGVIARSPEHYAHLKRVLTVDRVRDFFDHFLEEGATVTRCVFMQIYEISRAATHFRA